MKDLVMKLFWKLGISSSPVFISGSPRSGTTWVLETLEKITDSRVYWEPINWYVYSTKHNRYEGQQSNLRPDSENLKSDPNLSRELVRILNGGIPLKAAITRISRLSLFSNLMRILLARNTIIKFVFAQRALSWIAKNTNAKRCVILRHPSSIVASQLHHPYKANGVNTQHPEWETEIINRTHPIYTSEDLNRFPRLNTILNLELSAAGKLAVTACLDFLHATSCNIARERFIFIDYESLIDSPSRFLLLAKDLNLPVNNPPTLEMLRERSRTTSDSTVKTQSGVNRLSKSELQEVELVMDIMGVDYYLRTSEFR